MYKVIALVQMPDYKWKSKSFGPFFMKDEADIAHNREALIARDLDQRGKIIDYQISTIETK